MTQATELCFWKQGGLNEGEVGIKVWDMLVLHVSGHTYNMKWDKDGIWFGEGTEHNFYTV